MKMSHIKEVSAYVTVQSLFKWSRVYCILLLVPVNYVLKNAMGQHMDD